MVLTTDGTLVSCYECLRYMARAAAYAMRNPRTPKHVRVMPGNFSPGYGR